jgi:enamine deaminase RidA (YjgF/YER057c/UK114 family)
MTEDLINPHRADRRMFVSGAMAGSLLIGGNAALTVAATPEGSETGTMRKAVRPANAPAADKGYSPAIIAEGRQLLFISGQGPKDVKADMETQIRQTFDKIGAILKEAGGTFANVVIIRSFWVHLQRDLAVFRKVRLDYLVEPYPASTAVGTPELAIPDLDLEIEAIAII